MRFLWISLLFSSLCLFSCRKDKTSWQSDWMLPLVSDTLDLKDLVADSFLSVNGGYYQLEINRNILDLNLADYIEIPDTTVVQKYAVSASNLNIPPGTSFVNNNKDHVFDLQGAQLKKARISSGKIRITVQNPIETKTIFTVQLPGVVKDGEIVEKTFYSPPGTNQNPSNTSSEIDLSGFEVDLRGADGGGYNLLQSKMVVQSDPLGSYVSINNQDSTKFIVELEDVKLDYARGYFGNLSLSDTTDLHVDFLENITDGTLDLPATNIEFIVSNGIKVSARATLNSLINVNNHTNYQVALTHPQIGVPFQIEPATGTWSSFWASMRSIQFTSVNSNVEQFIENLGATQKLIYKIELNPQGNITGGWDEFFPDSRLQVKMKAHMPLSASMSNLTIQDTFALDLTKDTDKTHIVSGKLRLRANNTFPLRGQVTVYLLGGQGQLVQSIPGSELIESAAYGYVASDGLMTTKSEVLFDLPESTLDQIDVIKQVVVKVVLNTPDASNGTSNLVLVPEGAYMAVKLGTSFELENRF